MPLCASVYMCLVITCWERADLLFLVCGALLWVFHFPIGILGQVGYLIVSIPDLCTLTYLKPWLTLECPSKTVIRLHGYSVWSESSMGAHDIWYILPNYRYDSVSPAYRGGSRSSGKGIHMYKGVLVRFADFISFCLDSRPRGRGFEPHRLTALWSLSKTHLP